MQPAVTACPTAYAEGYIPASLLFKRDYAVSGGEKLSEFQRFEAAIHRKMDTRIKR